MRNVMIAAPSHDGRVNVWHTSSLSETCKIGLKKDINVFAIYMSFDSLVQRARNDIFKLAVEHDVDDLVFIDSDQDWQPESFFRLLEHDVDVVGVPVRKKSDYENYNIKLLTKNYNVLENGLVEVDSVGTGMLRISNKALKTIWENSPEYKDNDKISRMVFDVSIIDGELYSEDVIFCNKCHENNINVYIDPKINVGHSGDKRWIGDFEKWITNILIMNGSVDDEEV